MKTFSLYLDEQIVSALKKENLSEYVNSLLASQLKPEKTEDTEESEPLENPIPVEDEDGEVIAEVEYSDNLDFWDGRNWTCGETGRHKGLTRLESGEYVLIHGTQWQGERDHAEIISASQALQEILRARKNELLDEERFADLKELRGKKLKKEKK